MIRRLFHARTARAERQLGYDMTYVHELIDTSLPATWRYLRFLGMAQHREALPVDACYAAKLATTLAEDCGPCTQLVADMAIGEGVPAPVVRAIIEGDEPAMSDAARLGWRFARASLAHDPEADALRDDARSRWGAKAVVSLAFAVASARVFPTLKYALGHGRTCTRVTIGGGAAHPGLRAATPA